MNYVKVKGLKKLISIYNINLKSMLIPVRCFSCNNPVSKYYIEYSENKGDPVIFFEEKGIKKYCCRRMLLTYVPVYKLVKKGKTK